MTYELLEELAKDLGRSPDLLDDCLVEVICNRRDIFEGLTAKIEMFGMPKSLSEMDDS